MIMFTITVRDRRIGRDPALITEEGGEVLMVLKQIRPLPQGARLTLPDGTEVEVVDSGHPRGAAGVGTQTVHVDEIWDV
jgi:hypothetical protein